ncbi:MAG: RDD family protein [Chloroflexota bacterium]
MTTTDQPRLAAELDHDEHLALPYAGASLRVVSAILDFIVLGSIFLLFAAAAGFYLLTQTDWGNDYTYTNAEEYTTLAIVASYFFFVPIYFFCAWWWRGQTIGQMAVRVMVTDRDGYHLTIWQTLRRVLLLPLSILPLGIGFLPMFFDRDARTLHDILAGTVVLELP